MKHVKILGLLAVAAAALMAFVGTASATLTEAAGDPVDIGDVIKASSTHTQLDGTISITCTSSTAEGTVGSNEANHAAVTLSKLTFGSCGNHTVTIEDEGSLTITDFGTGTGTVFSTGTQVTTVTHSIFLGTRHCTWETNNTHYGVLTGGLNGVIHFDVLLDLVGTDSLCGNDAEWTGSYTIQTPGTLLVD